MSTPDEIWGDAELRHLRAFITVADAHSFSRAAERLGLTQPRVSQQIQQLEHAIGVELLLRFGRRVTLTPSGRHFYDHAVEVLRKMDLACRAVTNFQGEEQGHLRVGVVPICNVTFMPLILKHFHIHHPGFTIAVEEVSALDMERDIEMGRLDIGVGFLPHASPTLRYQKLLKEKFALLVREDHRLADKERVPMSSLHNLELVLLPAHYFMRHMIDQIILRHHVRPRVVFEINSAPTIIRTVAESGVATLMPPSSVRMGFGSRLKSIELVGQQPFLELGIMKPPGGRANAPIEVFCKIALEVIQKL